ncbi:MAG: DNA repair protein RadC [Bacteroidetes bacterium]|nr:DNA repair protein RadC [Bacteroidota bacterium]
MEGYRPITQWNEDDRPREKLIHKGRTALSDAELLAILMGTGSRHHDENGNLVNKSAVDLGKDLMHLVQNNLQNLARMSVSELKQLQGIGEAKALSIIAAMELGSRRKLVKEEKSKVSCSRDAYEILAPRLEDLNVEQFWVILLNRANMVIRTVKLSEGGITGTVIDAGPLFKLALLENAKGIILCHNHPSGSNKPSDADISITKRLKGAGALLEIQILDHLIITATGYYSMGDEGIL